MELSQQEKLIFSEIMFQSEGREQQQVSKLTDDEIYKLRKIYAQKIAYDAVNTHIKPPAEYHHQIDDRPTIPGIITTLCCCFYPEENRQSFDIKNYEFLTRTGTVFAIWKKNFLPHDNTRTELYGPLWITVTYIVILGIVANLNEYFLKPQNYTFNNEYMVYAVGISVIFQIAQPLIYSAVIRCLGGSIPSNQSLMLTGYSLMLYIVPTIFCFIPSLYFHLLMLVIAGFLRTIFLFRNYSSRLDSKIYILLAVILILQALYLFIVLRVMFPKDNGYGFDKGTEKVFHDMSLRKFHDANLRTQNYYFYV